MAYELRTLFRVESVLWVGGRCPTRKTITFQYGYFTTLKKAEESIPYLGYDKEVLFYIISEIKLDVGDLDWNNVYTVRTYDSDGKLIDETKASEDGNWHGRTKENIHFQIGDVVEVFSYFAQEVKLGIIVTLPNTTEEVEKFHKEYDGGIWLTIDDDMCGILYLDGKFSRVPSYSVFSPFRPVPKKLDLALEDILRQNNKNYVSQLDRVSIFASQLKKV